MTNKLKFLWLLIILPITVNAQLTPKEKAVEDFRHYFAEHAYRGSQLNKGKVEQMTSQQCIDLLGEDGRFIDFRADQEKIESGKMNLSINVEEQNFVSAIMEKAFNRIWRIANTYRGRKYADYNNDTITYRLFKAINNYSKIEAARGSIGAGRFHISCFAIPTAAVNIYFCLFDAMEQVENGTEKSELAMEANKYLLQMCYQSWTQPYRYDETDLNPVSVERFRKHVWWVGGNALGYRSILPAAVAMRSVEMMDVLAEVAKGALSSVSQNTWDDAFWTEGFTADGAGWGHGMQCLIWGYPISGTSAALSFLDYFKGTPWAQQLDEENARSLLNYFRGSSWYYYKGYIPRCLGRGSMAYSEMGKESIKTDEMINNTIESWLPSFAASEQQEIIDLQNDIKDDNINMSGYPEGYYTGTRWFFNNDNLIKKNPDYYIMISMASVRCDGIESFDKKADKFNFFTCDGLTFFMKDGNEYHRALGAWNLTAIPGVTSRQVDNSKLIPVTNWRGYCSKYNFAAAASSGTKNAASGFIFEKMNASEKNNVNDTTGRSDPNTFIYGVRANKAWFLVDDYAIALGAGITNMNPEIEGDIWTTIDQTYYNGEMHYSSGSEVVKENGFKTTGLKGNKLVWAEQKGGFAYAVLTDQTTGEVMLSAEHRKTRWEEINESNRGLKNLPAEADVFQLSINHGQEVKDGTYAYVVYAGKDEAQKAFNRMPLKILENSIDIQAVRWSENYIGASFYNPEKTLATEQGEIAVSAPCALMLEKVDNIWRLSVCDAEMNKDLKNIVVRTTLPLKGDNFKTEGKWKVITVPVPQGKWCGKPATVELL